MLTRQRSRRQQRRIPLQPSAAYRALADAIGYRLGRGDSARATAYSQIAGGLARVLPSGTEDG
jgi:hypothetical protein